jgi:hypothetical protein
MDQRSERQQKLVHSNIVSKGAHPAYCRRVQGAIWRPGRSLTREAALIVIVLLSLGLWGVIWLAVALLLASAGPAPVPDAVESAAH